MIFPRFEVYCRMARTHVALSRHRISDSERTWGMVVHLSALFQFIFHFFGLIIGPLIVWSLKKSKMPFVNDQGKEVLNFNMSITFYAFIIAIAASLLPFSFNSLYDGEIHGMWMNIFSSIYMIFLVIAFFILFLFWLINTVRGAITANKGISFKYPLTINFLAKSNNK